MKISEIILRQVKLPLIKPYYMSFKTLEEIVPIYVEVRDKDGNIGWGEAQITPVAYVETTETGYNFCKVQASKVLGKTTEEAKEIIGKVWRDSFVAATAFLTAIEMLEDSPLLKIEDAVEVPLLTAFSAKDPSKIPEEVERLLDQGFKTFKLKVGGDVKEDLELVHNVQKFVAGRAAIRIDANFGYDRKDGSKFASSLDPEGIEHFEQPCKAENWEDNAAVAKVSNVPILLDESIKTAEHVEKAAKIEGVGGCKLKLKRLGTLENLDKLLKRIKQLGMRPVLGDGTSSEIGGYMEACLWRGNVDNAGEFNGFLKTKSRILKNPLNFYKGSIHLPAGYKPEMDYEVLGKHSLVEDRYFPEH